MSADYEYVKVEARRLLSRCNVQKPPISLSSICDHLDIVLAEHTLGSRDAALMNSQLTDTVLIMVNPNKIRHRQRFSIAHEIGHYVLEHQSVAFSGGDGYMQTPEEERQADIFAAELLMPEHFLLHCWAIGKLDTLNVSQIFDVSKKAATTAVNFTYMSHPELLDKRRRNYWEASYLLPLNI